MSQQNSPPSGNVVTRHSIVSVTGMILAFLITATCIFFSYKYSEQKTNSLMIVDTKIICMATQLMLENSEKKLRDLIKTNALAHAEPYDIDGITAIVHYTDAAYEATSHNFHTAALMNLNMEVNGRKLSAALDMRGPFKKIANIVNKKGFEIQLVQKYVPMQTKQDLYMYKVIGGRCTYGQYDIVTVIPRAMIIKAIATDTLCITIQGILLISILVFLVIYTNKVIMVPVLSIIGIARVAHNGIEPQYEPMLHQPDLDLAAKQLIEGIRNRSDVKELREQLIIKEEEEKALHKIKSTFISCISHELRTPLNIIQLSAELIKFQKLGPMYNEKYLEYSENMYNASNLLFSIIDTILEVSKAEAGMLVLNKQIVSVNHILERGIAGATKCLRDLCIHQDCDAILQASVDPEHIEKALGSVMMVMGRYEPSELFVRTRTTEDGKVAIIILHTNLSENAVAELFFKFRQNHHLFGAKFTNDDLAISLATKLVVANNGSLTIYSHKHMEVGVTISLPQA